MCQHHQLYPALFPFTYARSESIKRWQSKLQLLNLREWRPATAGSSPQAVHLSTVIHTTLAGIEPTTFRLLVRRATRRATETTELLFRIIRTSVSHLQTDVCCLQNYELKWAVFRRHNKANSISVVRRLESLPSFARRSAADELMTSRHRWCLAT